MPEPGRLPPTRRPRLWRCGRFELPLDRTLLMGILNVTPDSFSDGGRFVAPDDSGHDRGRGLVVDVAEAVAVGRRLAEGGAAIVDVGGESTRPGAAEVPSAEERVRVAPVIERLAGADPSLVVSVDTRHVEVAEAAVTAGAAIVNDVAGFREPAMIDLAARCDAGLVVMHMKGEPYSMQDAPVYDDVVAEVREWLQLRVDDLVTAGVAHDRIAIDPGIGFGKTTEHNLEILRRLPEFAELGYPVVIGASRKRFIGELTGVSDASERLEGSIAAALWAASNGADVVRVHDVAATSRALSVQRAIIG